MKRMRASRLRPLFVVPFNYMMGKMYYSRKQYDLATVFYLKTLQNGDSKNAEFYYRYANALRKLSEQKLQKKKTEKPVSKTKILTDHLEEIVI